MSGNTVTLNADGRRTRCGSNRRWALAIPHHAYPKWDYSNPTTPVIVTMPEDPKRLIVRHRSDSPRAIVATARKLAREEPGRPYYLFDLADGTLIGKGNAADPRRTGMYTEQILTAYLAKRKEEL